MNLPAMNPPPAWVLLAQALADKRPVTARYHGRPRILCPHALGWKHGRAKVLSYQPPSPTSPADPHAWRSMFIDEIEDLTLTHHPWQTAHNFSLHTNCFDHLTIAIDP